MIETVCSDTDLKMDLRIFVLFFAIARFANGQGPDIPVVTGTGYFDGPKMRRNDITIQRLGGRLSQIMNPPIQDLGRPLEPEALNVIPSPNGMPSGMSGMPIQQKRLVGKSSTVKSARQFLSTNLDGIPSQNILDAVRNTSPLGSEMVNVKPFNILPPVLHERPLKSALLDGIPSENILRPVRNKGSFGSEMIGQEPWIGHADFNNVPPKLGRKGQHTVTSTFEDSLGHLDPTTLPPCPTNECTVQAISTRCRYTPVFQTAFGSYCLGCPEDICEVQGRQTKGKQTTKHRKMRRRLCRKYGICSGRKSGSFQEND